MEPHPGASEPKYVPCFTNTSNRCLEWCSAQKLNEALIGNIYHINSLIGGDPSTIAAEFQNPTTRLKAEYDGLLETSEIPVRYAKMCTRNQ